MRKKQLWSYDLQIPVEQMNINLMLFGAHAQFELPVRSHLFLAYFFCRRLGSLLHHMNRRCIRWRIEESKFAFLHLWCSLVSLSIRSEFVGLVCVSLGRGTPVVCGIAYAKEVNATTFSTYSGRSKISGGFHCNKATVSQLKRWQNELIVVAVFFSIDIGHAKHMCAFPTCLVADVIATAAVSSFFVSTLLLLW